MAFTYALYHASRKAHAKLWVLDHLPNHTYFEKRTCVGKCDEVIKYSVSIFSSFLQSQFLLNLCKNSDQT